MPPKKGFPKGSVCKPCWELKYCPYGQMVELFPFAAENIDLEDVNNRYKDALQDFYNGNFQSEHDIWDSIDRLHYLTPTTWEELSNYDPEEINCKIFGHACPVFITQSGATETKGSRRQGRYLPREIMLKVVRRDNHVCQVCLKYVQDDEVEFDHIIPHSKGGPTSVENIRLLCKNCNRKKSNSLKEILEEKSS